MTKIPFNVSARTARLIGRENVTNAESAIIELVKNGYDADANKVAVIFTAEDDLYIVDNGQGMTEAVIRDAWMTIGTDQKELNPYSSNKRIKSGAKGIGRFALDRLGQRVEMYTLPEKGKNGYHWDVDWNSFEKKGTIVGDVTANFKIMPKLNLDEKLPETYRKSKKFKLIDFSKGGTILKISSLRDSWSKSAINELYQNFESLVPTIEKDSFSIFLFHFKHPEKYGLVQPLINEDFDYRISAKYSNKSKTFAIVMERNEFNIVALKKKYKDVFLNPLMTKFPFTIETFQKGKYSKTYKISELISGFIDTENILEKIGDFTFKLTFAKNQAPNKKDLRKYPYKNVEYASRKIWLNDFGGIKMYRDNFRVRPYGEKGEDWLMLGERQGKSPGGVGQVLGGYRVRPNQVSGVINISRINNKFFQDKSSREGIQENEAFKLFKNILLEITGILERDRNTVFFCLSELYKQTDEEERIKIEAREAAARIKQDTGKGSDSDSNNKEDAEKVVQALEVLESEVSEKHEEIKILRSLASAGLITAAVAHELRGLENILSTRNKDLRNLIEPYIKEDVLKGVKDAFNPYILLAEMEQTDKNLQEWLNYALMPLKRDKRKRKTIFLKEYFYHFSDTWKHLLSERKISLVINDIGRYPKN